jgi:hypothetical protein
MFSGVLLWTVLCIAATCAAVSLASMLRARSSLHQLLRLTRSSSTRSLQQLDAEVAALQSTCTSLSATVKRLSARYGMADMRARRSAEASVAVEKATKAELRRALREGRIRVRDDQGLHTPASGQSGNGTEG